MREVVVIGGGLSGLAAAHELIQHNITPTLIEVKRRLGGGIISHAQGGFIMDGGPMLHPIQDELFLMAYLERLGLADSVLMTPDGLLFTGGTGALVEALTQRIDAPVMSRMAVSTLGELEHGRFSICMENGLLLDARAIIVAAPARYAERMFYTLDPAISQSLLDYPYADVMRVSLGFAERFEIEPEELPGSPFIAVQQTGHPSRVASGGFLVQLALPHAGDQTIVIQSDPRLRILMESSQQLVIQWGWHWAESDPMGWERPQHPGVMQSIVDRLPQRIALCGGDYLPVQTPPTLDQRILYGIKTAQRIVETL